jgi:hypothetical protein
VKPARQDREPVEDQVEASSGAQAKPPEPVDMKKRRNGHFGSCGNGPAEGWSLRAAGCRAGRVPIACILYSPSPECVTSAHCYHPLKDSMHALCLLSRLAGVRACARKNTQMY